MARWRLVPSVALPNHDPIKAKVQNLKRAIALLPLVIRLNDPAALGGPPSRGKGDVSGYLLLTSYGARAASVLQYCFRAG